jgi:hypothetical protein
MNFQLTHLPIVTLMLDGAKLLETLAVFFIVFLAVLGIGFVCYRAAMGRCSCAACRKAPEADGAESSCAACGESGGQPSRPASFVDVTIEKAKVR